MHRTHRVSGTPLALAGLLLLAGACARTSSEPPPPTGAAPGSAPRERIALPGAAPGGVEPGAGGAAAGAAAVDDSFTVEVVAPTPGPVGAEQVARIKALPGRGYYMNDEFPATLKLTATDGVTLARSELALRDAALSPEELAFDVKLTPTRAGTFEVPVAFNFAVCTDSTCDPKRQSLAIVVSAQ